MRLFFGCIGSVVGDNAVPENGRNCAAVRIGVACGDVQNMAPSNSGSDTVAHAHDTTVDPVTGDTVGIGEPGEICARGYQQMIEYLNDPAATRKTVDDDGFLHTGDLGAMDERGYITLVGRLKDLIIRAGENVAPAEIESALVAHDAVLDATVVGLPDDRVGEAIAAIILVRGEEPEDLRAQLEAFLAPRLARFKIPSRWFIAGGLPATPTGKVQKFKVVDVIATGGYRELD